MQLQHKTVATENYSFDNEFDNIQYNYPENQNLYKSRTS